MNKIDASKVKLFIDNKEIYMNSYDMPIVDLSFTIPERTLEIITPGISIQDKIHRKIEVQMKNKDFYKLVDDLIKKGAQIELIYEKNKLKLHVYTVYTYDKLDSKNIKTHIMGYII